LAAYSEKELKYARPIANAILERCEFREWLLAGTKYELISKKTIPIGNLQAKLRSPGIKNPYWFNYWCGKDNNCSPRIGTGIETDVLLILDCANGRNLALHLEIKRPGETLGNGQAESYPRRAACWANSSTKQKTVWPHQDYLTILVCGRDLSADRNIRYFDKVVFHDEVKQILNDYPEP